MSEFVIAKTLKDTFNAVRPTPLESGDSRYVDCTAVRGHEDVVEQLYRKIIWSERHTHQLFTGHRGCGKSTELLRLRHKLEESGFAVIYFFADEVIDVEDVVYSDVLVAIAQQVYTGLQALQVRLDDNLLSSIYEWFADVVQERESTRAAQAEVSAEASVGTPKLFSPLAQMLTRVTGQLRTGIESKHRIRQQIDPHIAQLIEQINLLLQQGSVKLQAQGKQGLVVIVDNLDRVQFRSLDGGERNTHDALYIEHGEQLCGLRCHMIYTVPIAMFYSPRATILSNTFPDNLVMPMLKTHTRADDPHEPGLQTLREILGQRVDLDVMFETVALNLLCKMCGGHPRDLMFLTRTACGYAKNRHPKPIDLNAAERAVQRLVNEYSRSIPEEHFPLLVEVHQHKRVDNDDEHRLMLHNMSVLEYLNGEEPWHDVHPAVQRLSKFKEAQIDG